MKGRLLKFLKDWMLVIGMISGAGAYLIYMQVPSFHTAGPVLEAICRRAQPILLFLMLFISFSRIEPRQLVFRRWHIRNLLIQVLVFLALFITVIWAMHSPAPAAVWILRHRILFESAMLCMICPTATACAVVTGKLGGDMAQVVMYTIIINLAVSVFVPLTVPLLYPQAGITFFAAFCRILAKVFPLLILPCLTAWAVRWLMPGFHDWVASRMNLSFYLWSISLTIAILMSTRAIVHSGCSLLTLVGVALVSMLCCIIQFALGRITGRRESSRIEASQAFGQKNTVFGIWMGYTFWNPLVSVAGGFYTIWHNIHNTRQLYKKSTKGTTTIVLLLLLAFSGCAKDDGFKTTDIPDDANGEWYEIVRTDTLSYTYIFKEITGLSTIPLCPSLVRKTFMYHSVNGPDTLTLSGAICWPVGYKECSEIWFENHYFDTRWDICPSQKPQPGMLIASTRCTVYIGADYQGLGLSANLDFPFYDYKFLARQSIDCFKAAYSILQDYGPKLTDDYSTFNVGASLGGAISFAVARQIELEPELQEMFHIRKTLCCSGPYDNKALFTDLVQNPDVQVQYPVGFLTNLMSLIQFCPEFNSQFSYSDCLTPEFMETGIMDSIANKMYITSQINQMIWDRGFTLLSQILSADIITEGTALNRALMRELEQSDLTVGWQPTIPILIRHTTTDEVIPIACMESVRANMPDNPYITYDIRNSRTHIEECSNFYTQIILGYYPLY